MQINLLASNNYKISVPYTTLSIESAEMIFNKFN